MNVTTQVDMGITPNPRHRVDLISKPVVCKRMMRQHNDQSVIASRTWQQGLVDLLLPDLQSPLVFVVARQYRSIDTSDDHRKIATARKLMHPPKLTTTKRQLLRKVKIPRLAKLQLLPITLMSKCPI